MKRLICLTLALLLTVSLGCQSQPTEPVVETSAKPSRTLPPAAPAESSEPVRVWAPSRAEHHPLRGGDFQNRALDRLLYEPLFDYTPDGQLVGVLAAEMSWSTDGLQLTYRLRDDAAFSNGQPVTSLDAAISLQTWIAADTGETIGVDQSADLLPEETLATDTLVPVETLAPELEDGTAAPEITDEAGVPATQTGTETETESEPEPADLPYRFGSKAEVYAAVTRIDISDLTLTVVMSEHIDNAPGCFIFPVLPAAEAALLYAPTAPGSGRYRLSITGDREYLAEPVSGSTLSVSVQVLDGIGDAMKQFQDGNLDLLLMDPNQYALYSGRQNVRFQGIPTYAYTYLRCDMQSGFLAVEENRNLFLTMLNWQRKLVENAMFPHAFNPFPAGRNDRRLPFRIDLPVVQGIPRMTDNRATLTLVRGETTFDAELGENLRLLFERFGYHVESVTATEQNPYPLYDLRILTHEFETYPDPYAFVSQADGGSYRGVLTAFPEAGGTLLYMRRYLDFPETGEDSLSQPEREAFAEALSIVSAELPIIGLAVPYAGIAYGTRVEGQLKTAYQSPYAGLEDLVVWPIP